MYKYGTRSPAHLRVKTRPRNRRAWEERELPLLAEPMLNERASRHRRPLFIDPLTDFGFKRLFGGPSGKKNLLSFLNALFGQEHPICDITYNSVELIGDTSETKTVICDIICTGENGEQFIVEMQRASQDWFKNRMLYYNSRLINEQVPKGSQPRPYDIKGVYSVAILEFNLPDSPEGEYLHHVCNYYRNSTRLFSTKQWYKFIELPKFNKRISELSTCLDKWLYLLKNMGRMQNIPSVLDQGIFHEAFELARISNLTKEENIMYISSAQARFEYDHAVDFAATQRAEKMVKGMAEKMAKGMAEKMAEKMAKGMAEKMAERMVEKAVERASEKGLQEGFQTGISKGEANKVRLLVRSLVSKTDFDDRRIANLVDTDEQLVRSIREQTV